MGTEERPVDHRGGLGTGGRFLLVFASFIIVVAGIQAARSFLVPILLAAFIAFLCWPPIRRLKAWGVPSGVAVALVMLGLLALLVGVSSVVGNSVAEFTGKLPEYKESLQEIERNVQSWIESVGRKSPDSEAGFEIGSDRLFQLVAATLAGLLGTLSDILVILLIAIFMLIEAEALPSKLRMIDGGSDADISGYGEVTKAINDFLAVKTIISAMTGVGITIFLLVVGVDYPVLWGLIAFLFNYIPSIGSILAAIPAVLLALITVSPGTALVVAIGYFTVNTIVGNVIEPKMMGKRLGLSVFVIVLSLLFWSWVLGPLGMLLSIPLTMIVKILMEHSEDTRAIAILLGPAEE